MPTTPENIRTLQRKLYRKAKREPACRFHALYDKVYRADILSHAYTLVRANKGSAGIDGVAFKDIEAEEGAPALLAGLAEALKSKTYKPAPVKRVMIPKGRGAYRPLGIPTIRDRVIQMAAKLVIEPIFEADFCETSYGFRPGKSAHDAANSAPGVGLGLALSRRLARAMGGDLRSDRCTGAGARFVLRLPLA